MLASLANAHGGSSAAGIDVVCKEDKPGCSAKTQCFSRVSCLDLHPCPCPGDAYTGGALEPGMNKPLILWVSGWLQENFAELKLVPNYALDLIQGPGPQARYVLFALGPGSSPGRRLYWVEC